MGLGNVLFGRKRLKKSSGDKIFALASGRVTLEIELGLKSSGKAAVLFKPMSAQEYVRAENEMQELLEVVAQGAASRVSRRGDEFGYEWLIVEDNDFEDLINTVHLVASELASHGFGEQLLAAIFRFDGGQEALYLIYGYKRGAFWPFIPKGDKERDNAKELELKAKLEKELPIEQDISRWFALFDLPI